MSLVTVLRAVFSSLTACWSIALKVCSNKVYSSYQMENYCRQCHKTLLPVSEILGMIPLILPGHKNKVRNTYSDYIVTIRYEILKFLHTGKSCPHSDMTVSCVS